MPVATASPEQKDAQQIYQHYQHLLPKSPGCHGQLSPTALVAGSDNFIGRDGATCVGGHIRRHSNGSNDRSSNFFSTLSPPIINLSPNLSPTNSVQEQRRSPPFYDLRETTRRRGLQQQAALDQHTTTNISYSQHSGHHLYHPHLPHHQQQQQQAVFSQPMPSTAQLINTAAAVAVLAQEETQGKSESPSRKRRKLSESFIDISDPSSPGSVSSREDNQPERVGGSRRRSGSQRRPSERSTAPRARRSPGTRRRTRNLSNNENSPERRAFQPPGAMMAQQIHPAALPGHQGLPHPVMLERVSGTAAVTLAPYGMPVYTGPHQISVCTTAGPLPMCTTSQPSWSLHGCQMQPLPSCNVQQIPIPPGSLPPIFHPPHPSGGHLQPQHIQGRHNTFPGSAHQPPPHPHHPHQHQQRHEDEVQLITETQRQAAFPFQTGLPQQHPGTSPFPSTPPLILQEPVMRAGAHEFYMSGPWHRMYTRQRQGRSGRLRSLPPPPPPYPGFLLHFLAMLGNPPLPPFGREFLREEGTEVENYEALLNLAERLGDAKPKGLTKMEIDQLPAYRFNKENQHSDLDQSVCVVCMSDFENRQLLRVLPCSHEFHAKCVDKWLKTNRTCPICRADATQAASASD